MTSMQEWLVPYFQRQPRILRGEFRAYRPTTGLMPEQNRIIPFDARDFSQALTAAIETLEPDRELSLQSRVYTPAGTRHIPMVDFSPSSIDCARDNIEAVLRATGVSRAGLALSGNSYHLYGDALLTRTEWVRFMGRLLTILRQGTEDIVDSRWVGHRLMGGVAALRLTNNTGRYKALPTLVAEFTL